MAESETVDCACSNISIMQLFHELKQRYPTVPDQIVSKTIQQNFHDKSACETILARESHNHVQSYPGALISGGQRDPPERGPLCRRCTAPLMPSDRPRPRKQCLSCYSQAPRPELPPRRPSSLNEKLMTLSKIPIGQLIREVQSAHAKRDSNDEECGKSARSGEREGSTGREGREGSEMEKRSEEKEGSSAGSERSERSEESVVEKAGVEERTEGSDVGYREEVTACWRVQENGRKCEVVSGSVSRPGSLEFRPAARLPTHNYQVAVECSLQPWSPGVTSPPGVSRGAPGDSPRSFTSVNLTLRPPTSEPQPPIEIQSAQAGQGLTYTTSAFDPKQGFQSQLQIRIGPGGGSVSGCRTHVSSRPPHPSLSPLASRSHLRPHVRVLLEKQRERRDLLSVELRREREKLRAMQNEVKLMQIALAQKPSPQLLPKLKAEIVRLRAECERLTAAVDLYADSQNNLPLGETDEEFYRHIYTGQRLQRDASWSCHVCTFRNHPLLSVCEECEMPRLSLGSVTDVTSGAGVAGVTRRLPAPARVTNVFANSNSFCAGAGTSSSASLTTAPLQER